MSRSYPILSSADVLLGRLHLSFQLHIRKPQNTRELKFSVSEGIPELAVRTEPSCRLRPTAPEKASSQPSVSTKLAPVEETRSVVPLGRHQLEVLSDLLEKGTQLRDKMLSSLDQDLLQK